MTQQAITKSQVAAYLRTVAAVAEAIRDLGSVVSGHLYERLMDHMSLDSYQNIIERLKHAGLVEERYHELFWIGPNQGEEPCRT